MRKPTLKTISEATGLALTTISRALNDDPKIAAATRERVSRVAHEMGYVPDRAAQRLRTGRTNVIALVLSPHEEIIGFRGSIIAGLNEALQGTRYHISMMPYVTQDDILRPIAHIVRNRMADGIVFAGTQPDDPRARLLLAEDYPFVSHGRTAFGNRHPWCDYDNEAFGRMAVERLVTRGRRRIAVIPPLSTFTFSAHMAEGVFGAAARLGVAAGVLRDATLATPADRLNRIVTDRMRQPDPPDGFICPGEVSAMAVLAALIDAGHEVGRGVDVIAKQTSAVFDQFRPRIDTIYEDLRATGRALGEMLLRRIAGEAAEGLNRLIEPVPLFRL